MNQKEKATFLSKKKKVVLLLILLLIVMLSVGSYVLINQKTPQIMNGLPSSEGTKKMSDEAIKAYANKKVSASQVKLEVYPEVVFEGQQGKLYIHNAPTNRIGQQAILYDEKDQKIAQTGLIKPGYEVDTITTKSQLSKGEHKGRIQIVFYDLSTKQEVGRTSITISIEVKNE
ncbi:hypothetical protein FACS1894193_08180 [Bacilli bacterium]|nr:hypothetical protein FACS1894192_02660 [Bacilli bacterium]GHU42584.1 hypothetical protein FACS1894193_08180 [Bacilli bacterium]